MNKLSALSFSSVFVLASSQVANAAYSANFSGGASLNDLSSQCQNQIVVVLNYINESKPQNIGISFRQYQQKPYLSLTMDSDNVMVNPRLQNSYAWSIFEDCSNFAEVSFGLARTDWAYMHYPDGTFVSSDDLLP